MNKQNEGESYQTSNPPPNSSKSWIDVVGPGDSSHRLSHNVKPSYMYHVNESIWVSILILL